MSSNNDLKSTLKSLADSLASGNKSASDVAGSLNLWLKEGGEALRVKIEDEVERSVSKMGFIKRGEFEALKQQVAELASAGLVRSEKVNDGKKSKSTPKDNVRSGVGEQSKKKPVNKSQAKSPKKSSAQKISKKTNAKKVK
jgi:hypothetical protein